MHTTPQRLTVLRSLLAPAAAALCVGGAPSAAFAQTCIITAHPASPTVCLGGSFNLFVSSTGVAGTVSYQWFHNGVPIGGNTSGITINDVTPADQGAYQCRIIRTGGLTPCNSLSNIGSVTVVEPVAGRADSVAQLICANGATPLRLRVVATAGVAPITYRWHHNGDPVFDGGRFSGATSPQLTISQPFSGDLGAWACQITNTCGSVMVTVPSPVISVPPPLLNPFPEYIQTVRGRSFSLTAALGTPGIYDWNWYVNGAPIVGSPDPVFSYYLGPLENQLTIWANPLLARHDDAQIELRLRNTCNQTNSHFTRLITGEGEESEPNNDKAHANTVNMVNGARIVAMGGGTDVDYYRIVSPPTGGAIHRRTVRLESFGGAHVLSLMGLRQSDGEITGEEFELQTTIYDTDDRRIRYYTCGEGADSSIYLKVARPNTGGPIAPAAPYRLTMIDEPQPTLALAGPPLLPNTPFTIEAVQEDAVRDTEVWCTDASGNAIAGFGNDDSIPAHNGCRLERTTGGPGQSMRAAVSMYNLANNLPSPPDDLFRDGAVVDSPNVTLSTHTGAPWVTILKVTQNGIERTALVPHERFAVVWVELPVALCSPADLGSQGGLPGGDGVLNNNDFIAFINDFFDANPAADLGVQGGLRGSDGAFDNNDFIAFIGLFFDGCD